MHLKFSTLTIVPVALSVVTVTREHILLTSLLYNVGFSGITTYVT